MTGQSDSMAWDFSHILAFTSTGPTVAITAAAAAADSAVESAAALATGDRNSGEAVFTSNEDTDTIDHDKPLVPAALGNFNKVWRFLGAPIPPPTDLPVQDTAYTLLAIKDDYASDGAAYKSRSEDNVPGLQWSDGTDDDEGESRPVTPTPAEPPLTKSQRKKANRRARRARALAQWDSVVVSESEADPIAKQNPAQKASAHIIRSAAPFNHQLPVTSSTQAPPQDEHVLQQPVNVGGSIPINTPWHIASAESRQQNESLVDETETSRAVAAVANATANLNIPPNASNSPRSPRSRKKGKAPAAQPSPRQANVATPAQQRAGPAGLAPPPGLQPVPNPANAPNFPTVQNLVPSYQNGLPTTPQQPIGHFMAPNTANASMPAASSMNSVMPQHVAPASAPARRGKAPVTIEPRIIRSAEARHFALLLHLGDRFPEDVKYLVNPMTLTTHNNDPSGIHVFVDASNIFIGFMNQLKFARGIHPMHQLPPANLAFDGLALLMERRRPVAKRVLVGSAPHLPAFDKAKDVGYECNILEKVYKARELTERQIYFRESDARRFGRPLKMTPGPSVTTVNRFPTPIPGNGIVIGGSSSETTTTPYFDQPKLIEQGVDEILHLKMMESIVDTERPSTMVLATGDAAAAEYSGGFMQMAERALRKGWKIELISWSKSISSMYTKKAWTDMWGDRFKIIYLDDYAEELLDMDLGVAPSGDGSSSNAHSFAV